MIFFFLNFEHKYVYAPQTIYVAKRIFKNQNEEMFSKLMFSIALCEKNRGVIRVQVMDGMINWQNFFILYCHMSEHDNMFCEKETHTPLIKKNRGM